MMLRRKLLPWNLGFTEHSSTSVTVWSTLSNFELDDIVVESVCKRTTTTTFLVRDVNIHLALMLRCQCPSVCPSVCL